MTKSVATTVHEFEAGEYYIGDPCYFIANDKWDTVLERTRYFGLPSKITELGQPDDWDEGVYYHNGEKCFAWGTLWGDGEYTILNISNDREQKSVGTAWVDAGLIGIMPVEAVDDIPTHAGILKWHFDEDFEVMCTSDHVFYLGNLKIIT